MDFLETPELIERIREWKSVLERRFEQGEIYMKLILVFGILPQSGTHIFDPRGIGVYKIVYRGVDEKPEGSSKLLMSGLPIEVR